MAPDGNYGVTNGDSATESDRGDYDTDHPLLELCLTSTKGLGLFAKSNIKRGTRLLSESPLLIVKSKDFTRPQELWKQLSKLSPTEFKTFHGLQSDAEILKSGTRLRTAADIVASKKYRGFKIVLKSFIQKEVETQALIKINATSIGPNRGFGIFPLSSRINHCCTPNVHAAFNQTSGAHTVHAIRHIRAGEEILTSYIDSAQGSVDRRDALREYGVNCRCNICKPHPRAGTKSEEQRCWIHSTLRGLNSYDSQAGYRERVSAILIPNHPTEALRNVEIAINLLKDEGLMGMILAKAYRYASKYSLQLGQVDKARAYAMEEAEVEEYCLGTETEYLNRDEHEGGRKGSAEAWMKEIERTIEKDGVKIRLCEKRAAKERKKVEKKAAKKEEKR